MSQPKSQEFVPTSDEDDSEASDIEEQKKKKKQQKAEKKKKVAKSTEKRVCFNTRIKKKLKICLRVSEIFIITVAQNLCLIGVQGRINVLHAHLQVYGKQKFETKENH